MARIDTDLLGLPIVSRADASIVGEVDALVVDDSGHRVAGFLVDLGVYEASVLPFDKALAIGSDALIVESSESLSLISADPELERLALKDVTITDATALTVSGKGVGVLGDFYVDTVSGEIVGVELIPSDLSAHPQETAVIPASCIERLGPEIAVLKEDYREHLGDPEHLGRAGRPLEPGETVDGAPREASPEPEPLFVPREEPVGQPLESGPPATEAPPSRDEAPEAAPKHFLIGKRVLRRIEDAQGGLVAQEGDVVDQEMIRRAKESDVLLILSLNVE